MLRMFSDVAAFRRDPLALMADRGRAGRGLQRLNLGFKPVYLVSDPETARQVLRSDEARIDKGRHIRKLASVVGWNSITMSGEAQKTRRTLLHRTFAAGLSGDYVPVLGGVVRAWIASLAREDTLAAREAGAHVTLRMICAVLFGPGVLSSGDESLLIQAVRLVEDDIAAEMFRILPTTPWERIRRRRAIARARSMMALVVERTCDRAASSSLLTALRGLGLKGDALRDEVLILLLAGHHTTGAAATWMLYHLASDPSLALALLDEAERLSDAGGEMTSAGLRAAQHSRGLAQEVLRLYPSSYYMARDVQQDTDVAGCRLGRGTTVIISQWQLHRDPRFWSDPLSIRLDRGWSSNPAYMPFGFGPRACTGMALAVQMLQMLALEFSAAFSARVASPLPVPDPKPSITLVPPDICLSIDAAPGRRTGPAQVAA
jgi:cytochrome P450